MYVMICQICSRSSVPSNAGISLSNAIPPSEIAHSRYSSTPAGVRTS
jgi:hypothetical protein